MSEVDEARLISSLRSTGAAVLLTSNRWASGRFADRIVVIDGKSGTIVESGTHGDLLNLGPERSLYAKQWSDMMLSWEEDYFVTLFLGVGSIIRFWIEMFPLEWV